MKYFGEPHCHVIDYKKCKEVFCFNENGEFETDDEKLIEWMKKNKNFIRCEENKQAKEITHENNATSEEITHENNATSEKIWKPKKKSTRK